MSAQSESAATGKPWYGGTPGVSQETASPQTPTGSVSGSSSQGRGKQQVPHHLCLPLDFPPGSLDPCLEEGKWCAGKFLLRLNQPCTPGPALSHTGAQTLPSLLPLPEPIPDGLMFFIKSKPPPAPRASHGVEEVGITVWSKGSRPSPEQEVPAGPRSSKSKGMLKAWVCSALCQEGLPGPLGKMGVGSQGQGWRGNREEKLPFSSLKL